MNFAEADYRENNLGSFECNPLIDSLKFLCESDIKTLVGERCREYEKFKLDQDIIKDIHQSILAMLIHGYKRRHPSISQRDVHYHSDGGSQLPIISNDGKRRLLSIAVAMDLFPQAIKHVEYLGSNLNFQQITYLRINCPERTNELGIIKTIINELHHIADLADHIKCSDIHEAKDTLYHLVNKYHLGLVWIDNMENIMTAKNKSMMIDTLISIQKLSSDLHLPLIFSGDQKFLKFIQRNSWSVLKLCKFGSYII